MSRLKLHLLGPPRLELNGDPVEISRRKAVALLAYLAVTQQSHGRDALAALLWPEANQSRARASLRQALSELNKALGRSGLNTAGDTVALQPEAGVWVDVLAFRALLADCQAHDHPVDGVCAACLPLLSEAVALCRDDFLAGFTLPDAPAFDEWQFFQGEGLRRELAGALERLVRYHIAHGEPEAAIPCARRWSALDPLLEAPHRALMRVYAGAGQRAAALRQYELCAQILQDELGVDPTEETTRLYRAVRNGQHPAPEIEAVPATPPPCPYRGLFAFREEDAPFFFGREAFTRRLIEAVRRRAMVAVIGPSGCGKSSVVSAGLLAHVLEDEPWLVAAFRPGSHPFQALAVVLLPLLEPDLPDWNETERLMEARKLAEALREGLLPLHDVVARIMRKNPRADRLLLVVDQFEELYTLCPQAERRRRLLDALLEAVDLQRLRTEPAFTLALAMRADFLGQALVHRPFADALQDATLILGPMTREELARAIGAPAQKQGVAFEAGLVERILDDVGEEPGNLPLVEFALTALWERPSAGELTHRAYEAIGRVEGALTRYAERVYVGLDQAGREAARRVLVQLVRPGEGTEDTRRLALRSELGAADRALVQRLADARLVVTGRDPAGRETVELTHEALIRSWERLQRWMEADRTFRTWQERLRAALRQWEASGRAEGALLHGLPLVEAEEWLAEREADLSPTERGFIVASLAQRRRRRLEREGERAARERLRRRIVEGLVIGLVVAITLAVLVGFQWRRAEQARRAALEAQALAADERDQAREALSRQIATQTRTYLDSELDLSLLLSVEAYRTADTPEARSSLLTALQHNPRLIAFLRGHTDRVPGVAFGPEGRTLVTAGADGEMIVWDLDTGEPLGSSLPGHATAARSVAFNPDGERVALGSDGGLFFLQDVATGNPIGVPVLIHMHRVNSMAFGPDGRMLASSGGEDTIMLWDVAAHVRLGAPLAGHTATVMDLDFSPDGETLASASLDRTVRLWDVATRESLRSPLIDRRNESPVYSVAFSPDGQTLASGDMDGRIILWDVANRARISSSLVGHAAAVKSLAFSPDGETLASGGVDNAILLWDLGSLGDRATGEAAGPALVGHAGGVLDLAFSPDGRTLASSGEDGLVILWDVGDDPARHHNELIHGRLTGHTAYVKGLAFSPDGKTLASGSIDNKILLWDVASGQLLSQVSTAQWDGVAFLNYALDGRTLLSDGQDCTVMQWDVSDVRDGGVLNGHSLGALSPCPPGRILGGGSGPEGRVRVGVYDMSSGTVFSLDAVTGELLGDPIRNVLASVTSIAFSPDGQVLALGYNNRTVDLWDVATGKPINSTLNGSTRMVIHLAFSPDGQILAVGSLDGSITLWDVATGAGLGPPLADQRGGILHLAFSPDGQTLASGSTDRTVMLWDLSTGKPLGPPLQGHSNAVLVLAFSPDGQRLASGDRDHNIILWDVSPESWQSRACRRANRNLTRAEWVQFFGDEPYRATCP